EAAGAVGILRPEGSVTALLEAIRDRQNYHHGKAQWVPQRALESLAAVGVPRGSLPELAFLLDRREDPDLQRATVSALDRLSGGSDRVPADLTERIRHWKTQLASIRKDAL
ncbi:MAG TPA: hypothetical protein VL588_01615, partial [Bdellovibrionota bacterium]|nr:hypothetical protein [Bdellovibrionota bacterium]